MNNIKNTLIIALFILPLLLHGFNETNPTTFTIGFGSCLDQEKTQEIWEPLKKENLNMFFFIGDNVYGDADSGKLTKMKSSYFKQEKRLPEWLKQLRPLAIWDDHDYGLNDGGSEYPLKQESQKLFLDFWRVDKNDARRNQEGIYFSETRSLKEKDILFVGLDTRYFRSSLEGQKRKYESTSDNSKTILGKEQWSWLESKFKEDVDLIVLVSSIQILATNHGFEKWNNFPHERTRLLSLIKESKKPVILVSGDRHKAAIYKRDNLYELTTSSLNKPLPGWLERIWKETDPLLEGEIHYDMNYGVVKLIDSSLIVLQIKNEFGQILEEVKIQ